MPPGRPSKTLNKSGARRDEELDDPPTIKMFKCDEPACPWAYETRRGLSLHKLVHTRRRQRQLFDVRAEALFRPQKRTASVEMGFSSRKKRQTDSGEDKKEQKEEDDDEDVEDEIHDEEVEEEEEGSGIVHPAQHPATSFSSSAQPSYSQRPADLRPGTGFPKFFVQNQARSVQSIFNATPTATQAMPAHGCASESDPVAPLPPVRSLMVSAGLLQDPRLWTDEPRNVDQAYQPQADMMPHSPFHSSTTPDTATPNIETYSFFLAVPDHARTIDSTNVIYPSSSNFGGSTEMRMPQQVTAVQAPISSYRSNRQWEQQPEFNYFEAFPHYESPSPTPSSSTDDSSQYYLDGHPSMGLDPSLDPNYSAPPLTTFTSPTSLLQPSPMYQPRWSEQEHFNAQGSMNDNTNDASTSSRGAGPSNYYYQLADAYDSHGYTRN